MTTNSSRRKKFEKRKSESQPRGSSGRRANLVASQIKRPPSAAAAALGGRLIWLATKFARQPEDPRGWLSLFLFSNLFLLLLFVVMVGERLVRWGSGLDF